MRALDDACLTNRTPLICAMLPFAMPLTFPSHAAAILPLLHLPGTRRLAPTALVLGSTAPDLIYLAGTHGAAAHLPWGLLWFCLPAGLVAFLYLESLVLPVLGPQLKPPESSGAPSGMCSVPRAWSWCWATLRTSATSPAERATPTTACGWPT